jgi:GT2 family glycosyltransferase
MPDATVVIVTRNRCAELRHAIASATAQDASVEVLVIDDASEDGTPALVRAEFPEVRLVRFDTRAGLVVRRNDAARLANGDVIVSLDDDAVFSTRCCVTQTLLDFDHPRVGAVAIPLDETSDGGSCDSRRRSSAPPTAPEAPPSKPESSSAGRWVVPTFRGTAYALRRDVFMALGGFREAIVHQGEEPDFCLRMLAAGYLVRRGRADRICHRPSPHRDLDRMDVYGRRNELLWAYTYFPIPIAVPLMCAYTAKGLRHGVRVGRIGAMLRGTAAGLGACWAMRRERQPLTWRLAGIDLRLRRAGALPLPELEAQLPALGSTRRAQPDSTDAL